MTCKIWLIICILINGKITAHPLTHQPNKKIKKAQLSVTKFQINLAIILTLGKYSIKEKVVDLSLLWSFICSFII